ncbi:uncharacterized protein LOC133302637 [Gastrolobium bilobum]|uniref:uncharacterized protein LOC133302637 n=1 Tax=Gastrolobium bilobum TaxID=150636 RepID=UPI002AAFF324|nr:uncharacterized protein LOC133302637 [Gastrolobium bilobum]
MSSEPFICSCKVISVPFYEAEVEHYETLEQDHVGDYFNIKVHVKHQLCFSQRRPRRRRVHSSTLSFDLFNAERSMTIPIQEFFEKGTSYMQMYFPHPIIPNEVIHDMMSGVITYAENVVQNSRPSHSCFPYVSTQFRVFTLVVDILVRKLHDEHRDDDITNMIMMESMRDVQMVPASKIAIESLKKVKLEDGAAIEKCSICLPHGV